MTIQSFIEKAIEGGWTWREFPGRAIVRVSNEIPGLVELWYRYEDGGGDYSRIQPESILLDPLAWKAVGKVEGWKEGVCFACGEARPCWCDTSDISSCTPDIIPDWRFRMHRMIDALAEGKTIEQYLETL